MKSDSKGFIYLIGKEMNPEYFKIGFSKSPKSRLLALQTASPFKLKIYGKIIGDENKEKELHEKFSYYKKNNEWFIPTIEMLNLFNVKLNGIEYAKREIFNYSFQLLTIMIQNQYYSIDVDYLKGVHCLDLTIGLYKEIENMTGGKLRFLSCSYEKAVYTIDYKGREYEGNKDIVYLNY